MIDVFHHMSLQDVATVDSDTATLLGIAVLSGFGVLSAILLAHSLHHKSQESDNPLYWPKLFVKSSRQRSEKIDPGKLSSWQRVRVRLPRGPKLN
jgi:hypothetical protein